MCRNEEQKRWVTTACVRERVRVSSGSPTSYIPTSPCKENNAGRVETKCRRDGCCTTACMRERIRVSSGGSTFPHNPASTCKERDAEWARTWRDEGPDLEVPCCEDGSSLARGSEPRVKQRRRREYSPAIQSAETNCLLTAATEIKDAQIKSGLFLRQRRGNI